MTSPLKGARALTAVALGAGLALTLAGCGGEGADSARAEKIESLQQELAALKAEAERVEDASDIKRLQRSYGYYLDKAMWDHMADLFAEDATIEIGLDGVYKGKDRIRDYLYALGGGEKGLAHGQLNIHFQLQPVIHVAEDGQTAQGRWRAILAAGQYGESAQWGGGVYENDYVKEDGTWKIAKLHWYQTFIVPYETGWARSEDVTGGTFVSDQLPPDAPPSEEYGVWPDVYVPPFHYDNPVSGEPWQPEEE